MDVSMHAVARTTMSPNPGSPDVMKETDIIRSACAGDGSAVRALHDRYAPRVYAIVRRIAGDDDLAQDFAQEAWVRAIRALPTFRGDARFSTWLHRIAVNAALQGLRSNRRGSGREVPVVETIPAKQRHGDALLERRLERCLALLPDGQRRVLVLHDVEGYTHEEIGEMMDIKSGTSKSQLFKARARMRDLLQAPGAPESDEGVEAWSI
jgi:RNA polymerase sigma-70 factor, ECF subfamily